MSLDGVIEKIRELEAERTKYKKALKRIEDVIFHYNTYKPTGFMIKGFKDIAKILEEFHSSEVKSA